MKERLTVIEVAEMAKQRLTELENAKDWSDLDDVRNKVFYALYVETDSGECNPQEVAIYLDIAQTLFLALLSPTGRWPPPTQSISDGQRRQIAELSDVIDERLEDWESLSEAQAL